MNQPKYQFFTVLLSCIYILFCSTQSKAQNSSERQALLNIKSQADTLSKRLSPEKVYLQIDRPYYSVGDTLWHKSWLVNAATNTPSTKSGLLHIEIGTDSGEVVQRFLLPLENGTTWGNIALNDKYYKPGSYVIRAYTNLMRNLGEHTFFTKHFKITGGFEDNWTVKVRTDTSRVNGLANVKAILKFSYVDKTPLVGKSVMLQVMNGRKKLTKYTIDTELTGTVDISFKTPQQTKDLYILARVDNKGNPVKIPLVLKRADDIDLQFMPEGGSLIAGITGKVGFKAIGADGKGVDISGNIVDSKGNIIVSFKSIHAGMGNFMFEPKANEKYSAKIIVGNSSRTFELPKVQQSGLSMFILNRNNVNTLKLTISASDDLYKLNAPYFLVAKARGVVYYAAIVRFDGKNSKTSLIDNKILPTGITHLLLTDDKGHTLNERLVFVDNHDELKLKLSVPSQIFPKDSVALQLFAADRDSKPVTGNFSVAITDDARVKLDTLNDATIRSNLLLTSELSGYVENPGFYFTKSDDAWQGLDNLLLTQGWVNYDIPAKGANFLAEEDYSVTGRLTNLFGKPAEGLKINLLSLRPFYSKDTTTTKDGRFKIPLPIVDTPAFILKALKKNGKTSGIPISVNEVEMPVFPAMALPDDIPWNVNTGDTILSNINTQIAQRKATEKLPAGVRLLQGVTVSGKKIIKESQNLNGPGNADIVLNEKDMEAAGKKTLLKLIEEKIPGFHINYPKGSPIAWYYVQSKFAFFIIDGVNLFDVLQTMSHIDERDYLNSYTAESIKGIELNYSSKYNIAYLAKYCPGCDVIMLDYAFIEITTRSGSGPHMADAHSIYLYKPLPLSLPAQFYQPRYPAQIPEGYVENRPTIAWDPSVIPNKDGKATVNFNAGLKPGNYTVILQGISDDGELVVKYFPLKVGAGSIP